MKQIALVTGGTRGIGKEIVKKLITNDIFTIFTGRTRESIQKTTNQWINHNSLGIELDLSNLDSVERFLRELKLRKLNPNIIIHNAGYLSLFPKETPKHLQKLFLVNSISPMLITEELLPKIEKGHLFFISPPSTIDKKVHYLRPYLQSKFAQTTYMKTLSYELKKKEISVNSLWTKYPLWTDAIKNRNIGNKSECVNPSILADIIYDIIETKDPMIYKGNEIIDKDYLEGKGVDLNKYFYGKETPYLDEIFLSHFHKQ